MEGEKAMDQGLLGSVFLFSVKVVEGSLCCVTFSTTIFTFQCFLFSSLSTCDEILSLDVTKFSPQSCCEVIDLY